MSARVHQTAAGAWKDLCTRGGLELDGRDAGLDKQIQQRLDPMAESFEEALSHASMADFTTAFFEALHPYIAIFQDILDFFKQAKATQGQRQWNLIVDRVPLTLKHFQRFLITCRKIANTKRWVPAIDYAGVWQLWKEALAPAMKALAIDIADETRPMVPAKSRNVAPDVRLWIDAYDNDRYNPMPHSLTRSRCPRELRTTASIMEVALDRLLAQGLTPSRHKQPFQMSLTDRRDALYFWTILDMETDHWMRTFMQALSAAAQLPGTELTSLGRRLDAVTDRYPLRPVEAKVSLRNLKSVLSLPIWQKRYELYSVWIATEIVRALHEHDVELHHENGKIAFAFRETLIATVHTSPGPFKLISERRSPLRDPQGKGRRAGIQPDHGLWTGFDRPVCRMAVEVKHYKASANKRFVDVFEDYASALSNGHIYLVNYGPTSDIVRDVSPALRPRCHSIPNLTPSNLKARRELAEAVRRCVGKPIPRWPAAKRLDGTTALALDISASMDSQMHSPQMKDFVRALAILVRPLKLVAIDTKIVSELPTTEAGFAQIVDSHGGDTQLGPPVSELLERFERVVVVTDKEGRDTLNSPDIAIDPSYPRVPTGIEICVVQRPLAAAKKRKRRGNGSQTTKGAGTRID
jgi:hypothetical protein